MPERETTLANSALFLIHMHALLYDCQRGASMSGGNNFYQNRIAKAQKTACSLIGSGVIAKTSADALERNINRLL